MRRAGVSALIVGGVSGAVWLLLFSSLFAVTDIEVRGATGNGNEIIARAVRERLAQRALSVFPMRNMSLLREATIRGAVTAAAPIVQSVAVAKRYPHTLTITITERHPIGIWCRGQECQFWDRSGARWGNPAPSIGPLLLLVQDERSEDILDARILTNLLAAVDALPDLGLRARSIRLPDGEPGGARITTDQKYDIYIDALADIREQFDVLSIFLADKGNEASFSPQYIDLRTPGRIYYK
jgi:hypothetical protein